MGKHINKVKEIDVAIVEGNKTLAAAVDRRSVERCKDAIEKLGVVHTPVVGATEDGSLMLLSGQNELTALRELGVKKMDAALVGLAGSHRDALKELKTDLSALLAMIQGLVSLGKTEVVE